MTLAEKLITFCLFFPLRVILQKSNRRGEPSKSLDMNASNTGFHEELLYVLCSM